MIKYYNFFNIFNKIKVNRLLLYYPYNYKLKSINKINKINKNNLLKDYIYLLLSYKFIKIKEYL